MTSYDLMRRSKCLKKTVKKNNCRRKLIFFILLRTKNTTKINPTKSGLSFAYPFELFGNPQG